MERDDSAPCPCGTGRTLGECCGPYLAGERPAPTAEALMRSRYTAFVLHDLDHVRATLHPRALADHDEESTRRWATRSEWLGLEVVSVEGGGEEDDHGVVEFVARYRPLSKREKPPVTHEERAIFVREKGRWLFVDSRTPVAETITRDAPKVGRNDPCPCGSGRKHKKCCGAARADA